MFALDNRTPYAAERAFVRDKAGVDHWVVAAKATFAIDPSGRLTLADEQLPPVLAAEYWGEPGRSSVRYETDLALSKPETDVIVNGSACGRLGRPVDRTTVRLRFASVAKALLVLGPRVFRHGPLGFGPTTPDPFVSLPIRYENAYGGTDTTSPDTSKHRADMRNPIGKGFAASSAALENTPAPSVLYDEGDPAKRGPAGFGALTSYWSPRRELAGTYDGRWEKEQRPLLPVDWSEQTLLAAPADQRTGGFLRGGEDVELVGMTLEGTLRFQLPSIFLGFTTHFGSAVEEHRSRLATVIIEPDDRRVILAWQTALPVPLRRMDYLDKTIIREKRYV